MKEERLMATAKKLPSGNYRARIFVGTDENGKRIYKSFTDPDKKRAEWLAAQYNLTRKEQSRNTMTVAEAIESYISNKTNVLSPSTIRAYRSMQKNDYAPIARKKLCELDNQTIQKFINDFAKNHTPKTVKNVYTLLVSSLKEAAPDMEITAKLPRKRNSSIEIPTESEVKALLQSISGNKELYVAVLLASVLGLRRGEICALEWSDLKGNMLSINKALAMTADNMWVVKTPKTESGKRVLPIPDWLKKEILSTKKSSAKDNRMIHMTPNSLTDAFIDARNALGFSFRLHDLRHYNASIMLAIGIPDKYAMQRMGHATPNMLKTVYQHVMENAKNEQDEKVNEYMKNTLI